MTPHFADLLGGTEATLSDHLHPVGDARQQSIGSIEIGLESMEIPVIDADEIATQRECPLKLGLVVNLHQHVEPRLLSTLMQIPEMR